MDLKIRDRLRNLLEQVTKQPTGCIGVDDDLFTSGVLDSFGMIQFLTTLEEDFDCIIPEGELTPESFRTLRTISDTLLRLGAGRD